MVYYILTDVAGKHGWCGEGAAGFVEIDRRVVPGPVDRFRTKAEANRQRLRLKKHGCHTSVARREVVLVAVRGGAPDGGNDIIEFPSMAKAKSFQRAMVLDGYEVAVECVPKRKKVSR